MLTQLYVLTVEIYDMLIGRVDIQTYCQKQKKIATEAKS